IGAAWSKRSEEGRDYLSLRSPDPFNIAILANLFDEESDAGSSFVGGGRKNG
ncbi:DUF736 family protein, partial [Bradyrhizobium pachyrhizi]|uniref:DUF736 family protein n=1 Tax=Bradyrhizobium pachyrhizi TaxID=280333 RepID=UPI000AFDDBAA